MSPSWRQGEAAGAAYRQEHRLRVQLGGMELDLLTRAGFPEWGHVSVAAGLLASHARIEAGERVLVCPCGHGILGVWAAATGWVQEVALCDTHLVAVQVARRTVEANGMPGVKVVFGLPAQAGGPFDVVLMALPKGRDLARLLFLECFLALRPGGRLYLAGPNDGGIKTAIGDAEALFGASSLLAYKGGNRVVRLQKVGSPVGMQPGGGQAQQSPGPAGIAAELALPPPYDTPGVATGTYHRLPIVARGMAFTAYTRPGVFSWQQLDPGTRMLLEVLPVHVTDRILDVGCGYGAIGLVATRLASKGHADLLDVDSLACECARATLQANGVEKAEVLLGDGVAGASGRRYSLIVSNPPFHAGHAVDTKMAAALVWEAYSALEPRGRLVLVASRFLAYDRLMADRFGAVSTLVQTAQYHVLCAEKAFQRRPRGKQKPHDLIEQVILYQATGD